MLSVRTDKVALSAQADKDCFSDNPTLSVENVGFFLRNLLYLRDTFII